MRKEAKPWSETSAASTTPASSACVFLCQPELIVDPALLARYEALLDAEEKTRFARFRFAEDAHVFLIAHALVRTALSQFAEVQPNAWRFTSNEFGRPQIDGPEGTGTLRFNLSHCRRLIACLVTDQADPGVDVEEIRGFDGLLDVAERTFSPAEAAALRMCPDDMAMDRFFSLWTLKESYVKARGLGFSLPLDKFSFSLAGGRIAVHFEPEMADRPQDWTFTLARPRPSHYLATALRHGPGGAPQRLAFRHLIPLVGPGSALRPSQIASSGPIVIAP